MLKLDYSLKKFAKMMTEFSGNLACPIEVGNALIIAGKSLDGATRFVINLRSSKKEYADIGLHLSCRFPEKIIIRNSLLDDAWGKEERSENLSQTTESNPIECGEFFVICIFAGETKFHISINHRPFCIFEYRIPINQLKVIEVKDQIQVITQIDHRTIYPSAWPQIQSSNICKSFSNDIPILFTPGHVIIIKAYPYNNPRGRFIIKFTEGDSTREGLHFNARFDPDYIVVRNAMKSNYEFGPEERDGGFPFIYDQQFCMAIGFTEKFFKFAVNGKYFCSFAYRSTNLLENLNGLKITTSNGMYIHVTSVDHLLLNNPDCEDFQEYSHLNNVIT